MRWMTYREIAEQRGIDAASAKRLATRNKWKRRPMDDSSAVVQVLVPADKLITPSLAKTTLREEVAVLRIQVARLTERLDGR
jgi:hypothetical protein